MCVLQEAELRDLGEHRLKDLSEPQRLYQLGTAPFPPLRTLHQTNLPVPATRSSAVSASSPRWSASSVRAGCSRSRAPAERGRRG